MSILLLSFPPDSRAQVAGIIFAEVDPRLKDYGYVDRAALWDTDVVLVCWEDVDASQTQQRLWVEMAIQETWEKASQIQFTGWKVCESSSRGIRIRVLDEKGRAPRAYIGRAIRDHKPGMWLNFTFSNWGTAWCRGKEKECIESIAVHEFGHALGFAHESLRPDAPQSCKERVAALGERPPDQADAITQYDPDSVMNYCNVIYINAGRLSELDVGAVQKLYGPAR